MVILPERERERGRESAICPLNMQSSPVGGSTIPTLMVASPLFYCSNIAMVVKCTAFGGYYSPEPIGRPWESQILSLENPLATPTHGEVCVTWDLFLMVKSLYNRKSMYFLYWIPMFIHVHGLNPQSFLFSSFCLLMTSLWFFISLKAEHPPALWFQTSFLGAPWPGREALGATGGTAAHHCWVGKLQIFVGPTTQRLAAGWNLLGVGLFTVWGG